MGESCVTVVVMTAEDRADESGKIVVLKVSVLLLGFTDVVIVEIPGDCSDVGYVISSLVEETDRETIVEDGSSVVNDESESCMKDDNVNTRGDDATISEVETIRLDGVVEVP